jgi:hypothetical protein
MGKIRKITSLIFLLLYIGYYVSVNFFFHSHEYAWGTVTHSHPFPSSTNTHTTETLQLIDNLTNTLVAGIAVIFFLAVFSKLKTIVYSFYKRFSINSLIGCNLLRAPPVYI